MDFEIAPNVFGFLSPGDLCRFTDMTEKLMRPELPAVGIVAEMDPEDRALLGGYGEFLPAQIGQVLIQAGDGQNYLYLVISGLLHVTITVDGRQKLVARIEAGETLGEINVFDPGKASATVTAQEFSQIWKATRTDIDDFVKAYPAAGASLLAGIVTVMCRRIRNMNEKLADSESIDILGKFW
jgi:CRP/FNR family transcriptional regulator, cyclic AMP receptor protein